MFRIIPSVVLLAGAAYGSVLVRAEDKPAAAAGLGGRWLLNPELSDDARQKMREAREGMRGGGSGGGGPKGPGGGRGGGMGGRGGRMGGPGSGRGGPGMGGGGDRESLRSLFEAPSEMTITPTDAEVVLLEKDGRMRIFHPDGKGHKSEAGSTEVKARWEAGKLVVETKGESGPRVTETFERAPDAEKLMVTLRLEGGRMPAISIKRVYEPAEGESTPSVPPKAPEPKP